MRNEKAPDYAEDRLNVDTGSSPDRRALWYQNNRPPEDTSDGDQEETNTQAARPDAGGGP